MNKLDGLPILDDCLLEGARSGLQMGNAHQNRNHQRGGTRCVALFEFDVEFTEDDMGLLDEVIGKVGLCQGILQSAELKGIGHLIFGADVEGFSEALDGHLHFAPLLVTRAHRMVDLRNLLVVWGLHNQEILQCKLAAVN